MINGGENGMTLPAKLELAKEEEIIERGMRSFVEVGNALMRIRDNDLYTVTHNTFEAYCKERWGMARRTAYQMIDAATVVENVRNCAQIPTHESQVRPLAALPPEQQPAAWQEAVDTAPEGKVTAAHVKQVVRDIHAREEEPDTMQEAEEPELSVSDNDVLMAHHYATMAVNQLKKIDRKDPSRREQGYKVINWCKTNLTGGKYHE